MKSHLPPLIQPTELLNIYQNEDIILIDASAGKNARKNYEEKHLDGALFVDLNTQLADIKEDASAGGRHPLPTTQQFSETLEKLGIWKESHVIVYDDQNGSNAAARFWWMLKAAGHEKVQVLDGGFQAAEKVGFPIISNKVNPASSTPYTIERWLLPLADILEVEKASKDDNYTVIDVRSPERYRGESEPIDLVAGHIPGAINVPFTSNLDKDGHFLSSVELRNKYQEVFEKKEPGNIIVHCGSGVTACHTLLAIAYAGLEMPKLYVGSWSEWSRNNKPIAAEKSEKQ